MELTRPRIPKQPPEIAPLSDEQFPPDSRPLWSVMIPAYNCEEFLKEAIESVLQQDPGEGKMQIEVCDDASTDIDVEELVLRIGKGRVAYFRQENNVGSLRNFETCINRSRGRLIHLLHGDDKVKSGFYEKMEKLFAAHPEMGSAFCRFISVDQLTGEGMIGDLEQPKSGILENWLERLASKQRIQAPSVVVRRSVYEKLGSFYGIHYGEDWEMWIRIAAHYPVGYIPEVLAEYRKHEDSISGRYILTGQNIRDLKKVMLISQKYFSPVQWKKINAAAGRFYARYAINTARKIWGRYQHKEGTQNQIKEALSLSRNPWILFQSAKLYLKIFIGMKR